MVRTAAVNRLAKFIDEPQRVEEFRSLLLEQAILQLPAPAVVKVKEALGNATGQHTAIGVPLDEDEAKVQIQQTPSGGVGDTNKRGDPPEEISDVAAGIIGGLAICSPLILAITFTVISETSEEEWASTAAIICWSIVGLCCACACYAVCEEGSAASEIHDMAAGISDNTSAAIACLVLCIPLILAITFTVISETSEEEWTSTAASICWFITIACCCYACKKGVCDDDSAPAEDRGTPVLLVMHGGGPFTTVQPQTNETTAAPSLSTARRHSA